MKKTMAIPVFIIPICLFLVSRLTSFLMEISGISMGYVPSLVIIAAAAMGAFVFRNSIYKFLERHAYGLNGPAILIYLLSVLVSIRYKGIVQNGAAFRSFIVIIGGGLLLGFFVLMFMKGADELLKRLINHKPQKKDWLFVILAALILNIQAVLYCLFMKKIFVWDNAGYFISVHSLNSIFPSMEYFKAVYESVFTTDYNYIISIPASIFCKLFGKSRLVFVLSIINCYVLPLTVLVYAFSKRFFKSGTAAVLAIFALPYIIFAANAGFIDMGGTFFALLAAIIFIWGDNDNMPVLSGICLAVCVLMRRWYSFYALSFIISSFAFGFWNKKIKGSIIQLLSFAFVLLFFAQTFVSGKLMADYSNMYSAYAMGIITDLKIFTRYYGSLLPALLAVWGVTIQLKNKKMTPEAFMLLQSIICFVLFVHIQTHGQQHLALYIPFFLIAVISFVSHAKNNKYMFAAVCVFMVLQSFVTFIPRHQPKSIGEIKSVSSLPSFSAYPPMDENAESFLPICEFMDNQIGEKGETVCFLASSLEMNYHTLLNAEVSLSAPRKSKIERQSYYLPISDVDNRDGLMTSLFECDYVLVPSKLQLHLSPEEQEVISVPYNLIINGEGIGEAYEKQDIKFVLNSGDEIFLYKRIRQITPQEIDKLDSVIK